MIFVKKKTIVSAIVIAIVVQIVKSINKIYDKTTIDKTIIHRSTTLSFFIFFFYYSSSNYYANQNSIYNNQRYQYRDFDRLSNVKSQSQFVFTFIQQLFIDRQFLWLTVENASNSKNQNTSKQNVEKFKNNDDNQQRNDKIKTYVVDEKNEKKLIEKFFFQQNEKHDDYHAKNENLNYYDQKYYFDDEMLINFISFVVINAFQSRCRRCRKTFSFNNVLHRHLREKCSIIVVVAYSIVIFMIDVTKIINVSNYQSSIVFDTLNSNVIIIRFNINFVFDFDIDYDFRNWNYIKIEVSLSTKIKSANVCIDIDADVTFENRNFYKQQILDDEIRIMTTSLKIRELNTQQHENFEYVICDIHIKNMKNDKSITFIFRREIHLIDNFKINIFIDNDVIDVEKIIINSIKKETFIINIDAIISIKMKSSKTFIQRSIHIRKIIVISSLTKMTIFIHHSFLSIIKIFFSSLRMTSIWCYSFTWSIRLFSSLWFEMTNIKL